MAGFGLMGLMATSLLMANVEADADRNIEPEPSANDEASTPPKSDAGLRRGPRQRRKRIEQELFYDNDSGRIKKCAEPMPFGFVGGERLPLVMLRQPWVAAVLGATVGFGTGYFYAGEHRTALLFSLGDVALAFVGAVSGYLYVQAVTGEDIRSGQRLGAGERQMQPNEASLLLAAVGAVGLKGVSRVMQSVGAHRAAHRTNAFLESVTIVPTSSASGPGAGLGLTWRFF